jgi:hypothetical protein
MTDRPPHISEADWLRMSWHARQKAQRAAGIPLSVVDDEELDAPRMTKAPQPRRRIRIHRIEPRCWEITDGVSTARTASAEAAWRLLAHLGRTA